MRAFLLGWCLVPLWLTSCSKAPIPPARMDLTARTPPKTIPWAPPSALKEAWQFDLGESFWHATIINDHVMIESKDGTHLVDARTGIRGPTLIDANGQSRPAPPGTVPSHLIILQTEFNREGGFESSQVHAFDSTTGEQLWTFSPDKDPDREGCESWVLSNRGWPLITTADEYEFRNVGRRYSETALETTVLVSRCTPLHMELVDKVPGMLQGLLPRMDAYWNYSITSLNPLNGQVRWQKDLGRGPLRSCCVTISNLVFRKTPLFFVDSHRLFVLGPEDDNDLTVVDLDTGRSLWRRKFDPRIRYVEIYPTGDLVWAREAAGRPTPYDAATGERSLLPENEIAARYAASFAAMEYATPFGLPIGPTDIGDDTPTFGALTQDALFVHVGRRRIEVRDPVSRDLLSVLDHLPVGIEPTHDGEGNAVYERRVGIYPGALASGEPIVLTKYGRTLHGWRRSLP